jgi:hypothetical protein
VSVSQKRKADRAIEERALSALRRAATGTDCVVCKRREAKPGHPDCLCGKCRTSYWHHRADQSVARALEWAAERARRCDRQPERPAVASEDTAYLGCMYCVSEGACPCAESECHYPTWERRVERVGPSDAVEAEATGAGWRREG